MSDVPEQTRCWEHLSTVQRGQTDGDVNPTAGCLSCELDGMPKRESDEVTQGTDHLEKLFSAFAFYMNRQEEERTRRVIIGLLFELRGSPERGEVWTSPAPRWSSSPTSGITSPSILLERRIPSRLRSQVNHRLTWPSMVSADGNSTTEIARGNHKAEEIQRQMRQRSRLINPIFKEMQFYIVGNKTENVREWCELIALITVPNFNVMFSSVCRMRCTTEVKVETRKLCNSECGILSFSLE